MFDKFLSSARSVVFLAREKAVSEGQILIEPSHIQIALTELHPQPFEKLLSLSIDIKRSVPASVINDTFTNFPWSGKT